MTNYKGIYNLYIWYWCLVHFQHSISVFVYFYCGIEILGTPKCPSQQIKVKGKRMLKTFVPYDMKTYM